MTTKVFCGANGASLGEFTKVHVSPLPIDHRETGVETTKLWCLVDPTCGGTFGGAPREVEIANSALATMEARHEPQMRFPATYSAFMRGQKLVDLRLISNQAPPADIAARAQSMWTCGHVRLSGFDRTSRIRD